MGFEQGHSSDRDVVHVQVHMDNHETNLNKTKDRCVMP
jgi:hypothetical protein